MFSLSSLCQVMEMFMKVMSRVVFDSISHGRESLSRGIVGRLLFYFVVGFQGGVCVCVK